MKSFKKNTRGQFTIIAALLISILTLSLVLSIHQTNLHRQQLRYEPVEELVLGITSDLDRCLTFALSNATQTYYKTGSKGNATSAGYDFISKWVRSILASYSHLGIKMNMSVPINMTEGGLTDVSWGIDWGREVGLSQVYTKFDLDIDAYGFKGWVGRSGKFATLKILPKSITLNDQSTTLSFSIVQGKDQPIPIPNLTPDSLEIWAHITKTTKIPANVTNLSYLGDGIYTVTFTPRINEYILGVDMTVVTPEDNIYVSTYVNKEADFFATLQSQEQNSTIPTNLGSIQLGSVIYTPLPNTTRIDPVTYILRYYTQAGYTFLNWTTTEKIHVANPNSSITSVKIDGNGTITAFYRRYIPPIVNLTLDSRDWENLAHHLGNITLDSTTHTSLPQEITLATGDYTLQYAPLNSSYRFLWWESSGGVIPWNLYNSSTTVTITGNGTVTAVYVARPPIEIPDPIMLSREENLASENLGKIQLGATFFELPNTINTTYGTYLLAYMPQNTSFTFLNWTTTGYITVADPYSNTTAVTISGTGTIIALYRRTIPPQPETVNLLLDSKEGDDSSLHVGTINLDSTDYALPAQVTISSGEYAIQYIPNQNHAFIRWEVSGNIIPWNSTKSVTTLTILGNGTLTAVYSFKPPTTTQESVTLQSEEENSASQNLGKIQLGATLYEPNNSAMVVSGMYFLEYIPAEGYAFLNWTTTGSITVGDPYSPTTNVAVDDDGTVTAFYSIQVPPGPTLFELALDSREQNNLTLSSGNVLLNSTPYILPNVTGLTAGNYVLQYVPYDSSYIFMRWEWTGGVIPWNSSADLTVLTVIGNGTITAVYSSGTPTTTETLVTLQSLEEASTSQDLGQIQFGDTLFTLNNSIVVVNGTYFLKYIPADGYTFINWTVTGSIIIGDANSAITSVIVDGDGTITAFYRGCDVSLDSRHIENLSLSIGNVIFDTNNYALPKSLSGLAIGDYLIQYVPPNSSYIFLWWEPSVNIIPLNSTSISTTARILGDGTLTAVYYVTPPTVAQASVTLQSLEEVSASQNMGKIRFGDILFGLPNSTITSIGTYFLKYVPVQGYNFLNWTVTGGITVKDPYSLATNVTVSDSGTITAFYRGCDVLLDSRHWENLSFSLGKITFGTNNYTLASYLTGLAAGTYNIQFIPVNSSCVFLWWEFSGGLIPINSTSSNTTIRVLGDGTLTAVYLLKPSPPTYASVTLRSREESSTIFTDLGKIQLGETIFGLPDSTTVLTGTYLLEYFPAEGYTFVNWTTTGGIIVQDSNSYVTSVTVTGNGAITAIYRGCTVFLNSRHWANTSYNLGNITLGTKTYDPLPQSVTGLAQGDYFLQYTPENSSYVFLWWEQSGNVTPWNWTSNATTLTVYGDGTITAVYSLISEPPPPFVGDWSTLYVDRQKDPILVPPFMLSGKSSHIPSWASTGVDKQIVVVNSPPAPTIYLARYVNITAYVGIDPPSNAKEITIEFGFNYSGQYYKLGNSTFPVSSDGVYRMTIDTLYSEFPGEPGVIPEGSVFTLTITVTFFREPWGTFKLFYWVPKGPSCIELF